MLLNVFVSPFLSCHKESNLLFLHHLLQFFILGPCFTCTQCHKIWGKLSDSCTQTPQRGFQDNSPEDGWDSNCGCSLMNLTVLKVLKLPLGWEEGWGSIALISSHCYLCNMRSQIQDKCMKPCSQTNTACHTQTNPPKCEQHEIFYLIYKL